MSYATLATAEVLDLPAEYKTWLPERCTAASAPIHILLAEDDTSDVVLTEYALDQANVNYELHTLGNGSEVVTYLRRQGRYCDEPKPQLLMLDLSMPGKDGFEVLAELAATPERFSNLPIVILTGDKHCAFLKKSYGLNIAAYITKPCTAEKLQNALSRIFPPSGRHT